MDVDNESPCFFAHKIPNINCNEEYISFLHLLESDCETPIDCASELEHLFLLAGFYDMQPINLCNEMICINHRSALLGLTRRKNNCQLCVDVFQKKKRSTAHLQRVTKVLALRVWNIRLLNKYNTWACTQCRQGFAEKSSDIVETKDPFQWLYDETTFQTPSTAASCFSEYRNDHESVDVDMSPLEDPTGKKAFKLWLKTTNYPGRYRSTDNYSTLGRHDQTTFRSQMKAIFHHILQQFAPNDADVVWDDMIDQEVQKPTKTKHGDYEVVIKSLRDAYERAEHWSTKRQLLSIVAADLPMHLLKTEFPGITDWKIKAARSQAYFSGRGVLPNTLRGPIERYTERQVTHFIEFIQSPHITTDMPFGERKIKLSTGEEIIVPDVIRNIIPSRIVSQYLAYCQETVFSDNFKPLGSSSLVAILKKCSATTRKSLAGLDNFSCDGSIAFDQLSTVCDELATYGVKPEKIVRLKQNLHDGRNYLKLDYRTHISNTSPVADHCSTFGLSDKSKLNWRKICDHDHIEECAACLNLRETFADLSSIVEKISNIPDDLRQRFRYRLEQNIHHIIEWKKHLLRTVHQDFARKNIFDQLDDTSIFIVADWAMKWIPTRYREAQRDFFGKRGLSWHLTYAIRLKRDTIVDSSSSSSTTSSSDSDRYFEHRTFCHVFDYAKQDGQTVISILCSVLKELKQNDKNLTTAYLRTDNAGCYKGSDTLLAVDQIFKLTGVLIRRYDFSDAQSGKGPCDRMAAVTKGNIRRFINEKHDCINSSDFVKATGSTPYMTVMSCRLNNSLPKKKSRWEGIQNFNNIRYEFVSGKVGRVAKPNSNEIEVTVWRAFDIGPGEKFLWSTLKASIDGITPMEIDLKRDNCEWQDDSFKPEADKTENDNSNDEEQTEFDVDMSSGTDTSSFVTFDCPEPHCIKQFRREDRLRAHLLLGNHKIIVPPVRLLDKAVLVYKDLLNSDTSKPIPVLSASSSTNKTIKNPVATLLEGWALSNPRSRVTFTFAQKTYLNHKYDEGELSGTKWDPATVAEHMQTARDQNGFLFTPDMFLTASQIKSYFSRITRERRQNANESQVNRNTSNTELLDSEDLQIQEEEDVDDFDSALSDAQTYTLLDTAISVLDELQSQQESN